MTEADLVIAGLAVSTISVRLVGVAIGQRLPREGGWAGALNALPGCLIASLVSVMLLSGSPETWIAASMALIAAIATRNLPITMAVGIITVWLLRQVT